MFHLTEADNLFDSISGEFRECPTLKRVRNAYGMKWRDLTPEYRGALLESIGEAIATLEEDARTLEPGWSSSLGEPEENAESLALLKRWENEIES